ncbi:hypothetical protein LWI29_036562 [Acer saccharum]|uniref:GH18 domain-containing protein n=1 Tax=Acer saccharum TaxID=4024 RepID=A0AA39RY31_ACESA|nr:hypothetical protein LWI29_036562 [Acer saccharum]
MYLPIIPSLGSYPVDSIQQFVNWVHVVAHDYSTPNGSNVTGAHAALYDPTNFLNTDYGINAWTDAGLSANKLVLCLPFYGYAWTLVNPEDNGIGAPAIGPAIRNGGSMKYKEIQNYIKIYGDGAKVLYSATYVVNYCRIGSVWIGFDDVEVVRTKVLYIKEKKLRGYFVWQVTFDDNWVLSQAAAEVVQMKVSVDNYKNGKKKVVTAIINNHFDYQYCSCSATNMLFDILQADYKTQIKNWGFR